MSKTLSFLLAGALTSVLLPHLQLRVLAEPARPTETARYESTLNRMPPMELPAKAAGLVQSALPAKRLGAAQAVITAVAHFNPAALPSVVGAISRAEPSLASKIALQAAQLEPRLAHEIVQAAEPSAKSTDAGSSTGTGAAGTLKVITTAGGQGGNGQGGGGQGGGGNGQGGGGNGQGGGGHSNNK